MKANSTGAGKSLAGMVAVAMVTPILMLFFVVGDSISALPCRPVGEALIGFNRGVDAAATGRVTLAESGTPTRSGSSGTRVTTVSDAAATPAVGDVEAQLMRMRLAAGYPTMSAEQARNAVAIAQVANGLNVSRYGLQVALAAAIAESKLVNLNGGDADSLGLFQQRPSTGWGTRAQISDPILATQAFFGRAEHTNNTGLLDLPDWENMPLTEAAAAVQRPREDLRGEYAQWERIAGEVADVLDADHPVDNTVQNCPNPGAAIGAVTLASFNILGASHTDGKAGHGLGGIESKGFPTWDKRLPGALAAMERHGVTVAGLQEVQPPQGAALAKNPDWGVWPTSKEENKVVWDKSAWRMADARLVPIPYFYGTTGMPLVKLTSTTDGSSIWVWSVHNPRPPANAARYAAVAREAAELAEVNMEGLPVFIVGDFNDGRDGSTASQCVLTPLMKNAFGTGNGTCAAPRGGAPIDHIYGAGVDFAEATVDASTRAEKISDHPLVVATTVAVAASGAAGSGDGTGPFTPSPIPYVGPFDAATLNSRMQTIIRAKALPNLDPFFGTQSDRSWYRDCQKFVAILDGRPASGYTSASAAWARFVATGQAHPVGRADAMAPPVGAWLYYGANHVVVYLGNNLVAGTDTWGTGTAQIGPAADISNGIWHLRYRGWAAPWGI
jgi:endonuclease/exonuclease/phosphatase family metal-dependent hydrolase